MYIVVIYGRIIFLMCIVDFIRWNVFFYFVKGEEEMVYIVLY